MDESERARSRPRWLESSSMVPYASRRMSSLCARWPPTSDVVPASPVPVYSLLFSMIVYCFYGFKPFGVWNINGGGCNKVAGTGNFA